MHHEVITVSKKQNKKPGKKRKFTSLLTASLISLPPLTLYILEFRSDIVSQLSSRVYELKIGRKFGPDRREKATKQEQFSSPVVRIYVTHKNSEVLNLCTAAAVAKYVFVTAAHCLKGNVDQIILDRGEYLPGQMTTFATTDQYEIHKQYDGNINNDIALIFTGNPDDRPVNRWFKVDVFPIKQAETLELKTQGFPFDKKGTMWKATYKGFQTGRSNKYLSSPGVTFEGQSGSPIFAPKTEMRDNGYIDGTIFGVLTGYVENPKKKGEGYTSFEPFDRKDVIWINNLTRDHETKIKNRYPELAKYRE